MVIEIREWIITVSILVGTIVAVMVFWKNIKKPKAQAPPETPKRLFHLATRVLVAVLCLCVVVVATGFSQNQKVIDRTVKEIHRNVKRSEKRLHKCIQDNAETIINKLDELDFLLFIEEPNNVK